MAVVLLRQGILPLQGIRLVLQGIHRSPGRPSTGLGPRWIPIMAVRLRQLPVSSSRRLAIGMEVQCHKRNRLTWAPKLTCIYTPAGSGAARGLRL